MNVQICFKLLASRFIAKVQCLMTRQVFPVLLDLKQDSFIFRFLHEDQVKLVIPGLIPIFCHAVAFLQRLTPCQLDKQDIFHHASLDLLIQPPAELLSQGRGEVFQKKTSVRCKMKLNS